MARIKWNAVGEHFYETGVKKGVLYLKESDKYPKGVPWNGLISVTESPSGAEPTSIYADDTKYLTLRSTEEFGVTIEAFTYPDEFQVCDGTAEIAKGVIIGQQPRKHFGMCYRTVFGNDINEEDYGYKLHIFYDATASVSEKAYKTGGETPEAITFSWEVTTVPVEIEGFKPTASIVIDSTKVDAAKLASLEDILYGTDDVEARLPLPDEIATLMAEG